MKSIRDALAITLLGLFYSLLGLGMIILSASAFSKGTIVELTDPGAGTEEIDPRWVGGPVDYVDPEAEEGKWIVVTWACKDREAIMLIAQTIVAGGTEEDDKRIVRQLFQREGRCAMGGPSPGKIVKVVGQFRLPDGRLLRAYEIVLRGVGTVYSIGMASEVDPDNPPQEM